MCASCGCEQYTERHPGSASIIWQDIVAAAKDAGITPDEAVSNMDQAARAMVVKASPERRFLLMVVYSPHRMPFKGADKRTDLVSPEVLERAAWNYAAKGFGTGMWHEPGHEDEAVCVENTIWRAPDWHLTDAAGNPQVVKAGDWLAGFILSPGAWRKYQEGLIGGVSMQGDARRKPASPEALARVMRSAE